MNAKDNKALLEEQLLSKLNETISSEAETNDLKILSKDELKLFNVKQKESLKKFNGILQIGFRTTKFDVQLEKEQAKESA